MADPELDEMIEMALHLIGDKSPFRWYERLLVKQSDRIQLATLAVVIAIYRKLA